jgi:hypothetical protein
MKFLFIFSLLLSAQAFATISELKSYKDFDWTQVDSQTLVVFDIDNTLIRQNQMIGTHQWGDYMRERAIKNGMSPEKAKPYQIQAFSELQPHLEVVPVEKEIMDILEDLSRRQINHFALTARPSTIVDTTLKQLQIVHHDFGSAFPEQKDPKKIESYLKSGVIFSGETPKGELLKIIVENSTHPIKKIIFFDDKKYNLESVEKSLADSPIELISLRYGGADKIVNSFDPIIADLEYSFFTENREIISDRGAIAISGDLSAITEMRVELELSEMGPWNKAGGSCYSDENKSTSVHPIYMCPVILDEVPTELEFKYNVDPLTNSITFGTW